MMKRSIVFLEKIVDNIQLIVKSLDFSILSHDDLTNFFLLLLDVEFVDKATIEFLYPLNLKMLIQYSQIVSLI